MKEYPCNGKRCPMNYNAVTSVENCKLFHVCNFYEPKYTAEHETLLRMLADELRSDGERRSE